MHVVSAAYARTRFRSPFALPIRSARPSAVFVFAIVSPSKRFRERVVFHFDDVRCALGALVVTSNAAYKSAYFVRDRHSLSWFLQLKSHIEVVACAVEALRWLVLKEPLRFVVSLKLERGQTDLHGLSLAHGKLTVGNFAATSPKLELRVGRSEKGFRVLA